MLFLVVGAIFSYFLYSESGHARISTLLSQKLSHELGRDIRLHVQEISLSPAHLDSTIMIEDKLQVKLEGFRSLLGAYDIHYELIGDEIDIKGTLQGEKDEFLVKGAGVLMQGSVVFSLRPKEKEIHDIFIDAKGVDSAKLVRFLEQKPLFAGTFSLLGKLPRYSAYMTQGDVKLSFDRGGVYLKNIEERFGVKLPSDFMASAQVHMVFAKNAHTFDGQMQSTLANVTLSEGKFVEVSKQLNVRYIVDIPQLEKLSFVTRKIYSGAFLAKGEVEYIDGALRFDGKSHSLDGALTYYFEKGNLQAKLREASLAKVFNMLHYPAIMIGQVRSDISYDSLDKVALINMESNNASFANSSVVQKIQRASGVDLSAEVFERTYFSASVQESVVSYDFKAQNKKGYLSLSDAKMDAKQNTIASHFDIQMQNEELSGEIYGSLKSPKVKLDIAKFIEYKAKKEIDDFFGIGTSEQVKEKLDGLDANKVKGFLKSFF